MGRTSSSFTTSLFGGALFAAGLTTPAPTTHAQTLTYQGEIRGFNGYAYTRTDGYVGFLAAGPYDYSNPLPDEPVTYNSFNFGGSTTVDRWSFTVTDPGLVTIDALSWGQGDTWFDTFLRVFHDDGDLTPDDDILANDDFFLGLDTNQSRSVLDAFIAIELDAGDYFVFVGSDFVTIEDAIAGTSGGTLIARGFQPTSAASYRLDISGAFVIPAPHTAALLTLAGLAAPRRR